MSKTDPFLICANIIHNSSEANFYKTVLTSTHQMELILINPDEGPLNTSNFEPFKTKSKIIHSPPKSPLKSLPCSQDPLAEKDSNSPQIERKCLVDSVFKGGDREVFDGLSRVFEDFLDGKGVLIVNWFRKLGSEGFFNFLNEMFIGHDGMEFSIIGLIDGEIKENKPKFEPIDGFENEINSFLKGNKKNFVGMMYRFRLNNKKMRKNQLIIVDLFNVIEKFNGVDNVFDALNGVGKGFYRILTDQEEKRMDINKIMAKTLKHEQFLIVPIVNLKDIQPYYSHIEQGMKFIEEINGMAEKLRKSWFVRILVENNTNFQKKQEKKSIQIQKNNEDQKNIEFLKAELERKEEILRRFTVDKSTFQEDKSLLEGILEETVTNSNDSNHITAKKPKENDKYREFFIRLLRNYSQSYSENAVKNSIIIDISSKLNTQQKKLYLEREKLLLKELSSFFILIFKCKIHFLKKTGVQDEAKEYKEKFDGVEKELNIMNVLYKKTKESVSKLKIMGLEEK